MNLTILLNLIVICATAGGAAWIGGKALNAIEDRMRCRRRSGGGKSVRLTR